ncbi:MAG TPA: hypothetical protein VFT23_08675 [Burkholderiales bacterium]|nr:hypothetical protein [Burkholderiales bacterium]
MGYRRSRCAFVVTDAEIAAVRVPTLALVGAADPAAPRVRAIQQRWLEVDVAAGATHPTVHRAGCCAGLSSGRPSAGTLRADPAAPILGE